MRKISVDEAVEMLQRSVPVAFPTETVYGLGASVFDEHGIAAIFQMKGRPQDNPLICHIGQKEDLGLLAEEIPQIALDLIERFWPGPLTLVLKRRRDVPMCVTGGLETVAVRMPSHPVALELIRRFGGPLAAPSANLSGRPSSTRAEHVIQDFPCTDGGVIDGGETMLGLESTVLLLTEKVPVILRPGSIGIEEIEEVVKCCRLGEEGEGHASPGTRYRHYAPKARVVVKRAFEEVERGDGQFLMSTEEREGFHWAQGRNLYALLRQADVEGWEEIVVVCTEEGWNDLAFRDRLSKAAGVISTNIPNAKTRKAIAEVEKGVGVTRAKNVDELKKQLGF